LKSAVLLLCGLVCFADETAKPPCNAQNIGDLWPEQVNSDARRKGCEQVFVCSPAEWKYRWKPVTVHVSQLGKGPKRNIPGCAKAEQTARNYSTKLNSR
jgi:hypothetical protein